jgi:hypothetical protein
MRLAALLLLVFPFFGWADDGGKVNIHPKTGTNQLTIHIEEQIHASMVQIMNEEGQVLWTEHRKEKEFVLNMKYFPPGTYTVQVSVFDQVKKYSFTRAEIGY